MQVGNAFCSGHNEATEETSKAFNTFWSTLLRPHSVHSELTVVTLNAQLLVQSARGSFPEVHLQGPRHQTMFDSLDGFSSGNVWCTKE